MATTTVSQVLTIWAIEAENGFFDSFQCAGTSKQVAVKQFKKQHPDAGNIIKIKQVDTIKNTVETTTTNGNGNAQPIKPENVKKEDKDAVTGDHPATLKDLVKLSESKAVNTLLSKVIYGQTIAVVGKRIPPIADMKEASYTGCLYMEKGDRGQLILAGNITQDTVMLDSDFTAVLISEELDLKDIASIEKEISQAWCHKFKLDALLKRDAKNAEKTAKALKRRARFRK